MMEYAWPILTCFLMFVCFWIGRLNGFVHGEDEGFQAGVDQTTPVITKVILEWVRVHKDVQISDPEIQDIIANTTVKWVKDDSV